MFLHWLIHMMVMMMMMMMTFSPIIACSSFPILEDPSFPKSSNFELPWVWAWNLERRINSFGWFRSIFESKNYVNKCSEMFTFRKFSIKNYVCSTDPGWLRCIINSMWCLSQYEYKTFHRHVAGFHYITSRYRPHIPEHGTEENSSQIAGPALYAEHPERWVTHFFRRDQGRTGVEWSGVDTELADAEGICHPSLYEKLDDESKLIIVIYY